jgi:putative addiction module antidote
MYTIVSTNVATIVTTQEHRMTTIKIRNVGNSLGIVLPKELIARLRVSKGDKLFVQETVDGIQLTPYDPEFQQQMEMREDRDALRALSK